MYNSMAYQGILKGYLRDILRGISKGYFLRGSFKDTLKSSIKDIKMTT